MREPMIVDHAQIAPYACKCSNTTGPFLDTFFEDAAGRVYVCMRCAKTYARIAGYAPGKKLDELEAAAALVEGKDAEIAALVEQVRVLQAATRSGDVVEQELSARLQEAENRLSAIVHLGESLVVAAHEIVGVASPGAEVLA